MRETFASKDGTCQVRRISDGQQWKAAYQIGSVYTGKQRVFDGYRVVVTTDEFRFSASDNGSMRAALKGLISQMKAEGYDLLVAGASRGYSESGLSFNSGFGYLKGERRAVHMMDPLKTDERPSGSTGEIEVLLNKPG